jgi:hypothetical protein
MQELYLEDYDVNLQFPDEMSEDRIMQIIQRDYPELDSRTQTHQRPPSPGRTFLVIKLQSLR